MNSAFFQLLLFGLLAAIANIVGGLVLFPSTRLKNYRQFLKYLLAIGAGFMLAVTIFEILPKTILIWQKRFPDSGDELIGQGRRRWPVL